MKLNKVLAIIASISVVGAIIFLPLKKVELYLLFKLYEMGSGMDDGAVSIFVDNKKRYRDTVLKMLENSTPGSFNANASFIFGELSMGDPKIDNKIRDLAISHPDSKIRCFWHDVVNDRFEQVKISSSNDGTVSVYQVVDHGTTCSDT